MGAWVGRVMWAGGWNEMSPGNSRKCGQEVTSRTVQRKALGILHRLTLNLVFMLFS